MIILPVLLYSSIIICRILCLFSRASMSLGSVTSSLGPEISQGGSGGKDWSSWFNTVWDSVTEHVTIDITKKQQQQANSTRHFLRMSPASSHTKIPLSTGPPRSSSLRVSSSLKAWFLCLRPAAKPQMGLSTGRATSTSWVISAKRITSYTQVRNPKFTVQVE